MIDKEKKIDGLTHLGNQTTSYQDVYHPEVLEKFENKHPQNDYFVKFNCPEFTSLCPITGQPDFAAIYIFCTEPIHGREQISKTVFVQLSKSREFSRGLCKHHYEGSDQTDGPKVYRSMG